MAFDLLFTSEFFYGEDDPCEVVAAERPTSVWQAIHSMTREDWTALAREVFDLTDPDMLTPGAVMEKIRETDACRDLRSPVRVYIDAAGWHYVDVYDAREGG